MIYKQSLGKIVASQCNFESTPPVMDEFTQSADYWTFGESYKYIWVLLSQNGIRGKQQKMERR